ncbi:nuclear transport factor 2 family protein [Streptomyces sp. S186]|uniref:nuclear transport factor 2 family protein n=1 Tax=Streptomyces sp. S186 TaxID=3434395 RepID=UPI003F67C84D
MTLQTLTPPTTEALALAALRAEAQQFYAHHMQLLDAGAAEEWAAGFTADGTFDVPTAPEPVRGRAALAAAARTAHTTLAENGEQHRHWPGVFDIRPQEDGTVRVRSYAVVYATTRGGASRVHRVCTCDDVLVREDGVLRISARVVRRDDLG